MANLPESPTWVSGIYQIETTDPVVGGPDGISNLQAKQLANRTAWLKQIADEVIAARGGKSSLDERLDQYDAYSPEQQTDIVAGILEALGLGGLLSKEIENIRKRVFAQGVAYLKNKYVIQGFVLTKSDIRALHLSETGTVGTGVSRAKIDGMIISVADDDYHVSVPTNEDNYDKTYYAYLRKQTDGTYRVEIKLAVPPDGLVLYSLLIPAGDTRNLNNVTLTDLRTVQPENGWIINSRPYVYVPLPYTLPSADYGVDLEVEGVTDISAVGSLRIYNRQTNGFRIEMTGSADNVRIRWTLHNINYA
ncbi:MAG TPA: hypothetical protein PKU94_07580 [Candidatus Hydrothermia bacterium]|nr:hypothetical protein [Candidatus Hydrothermia bacterium]